MEDTNAIYGQNMEILNVKFRNAYSKKIFFTYLITKYMRTFYRATKKQ